MSEHAEKQKWVELASKQLKGKSPEELDWKTSEGIEVKALYTAGDIAGMGHVNMLPGFAPYVRGPMAAMYAGAALVFGPGTVITTSVDKILSLLEHKL